MVFHAIQKAPARLAAASAIWLLLTSTAHAFFPFVTDDTGTQGAGGNQIEIGYDFNKNHNTIVNEDNNFVENQQDSSNAFPMTYTRGISDDLDLFVGVTRQTSPSAGWQSSQIGLKWVFAGDQNQGWSAAVKPTVILPVTSAMQDKGLGSAKTNAAVTLVSSYLADTHEWHFNAGYATNQQKRTPDTEPERQNIWSVSVAPVLVLNPAWKVGLDVGLQTNPAYNSRFSAFGEVGLVYAPLENLQLGLGVIYAQDINARARADNYTLTTGLAYQF